MKVRPDEFVVHVAGDSADVVRLTFCGDLDFAVGSAMLSQVIGLLPEGGKLRVELDLSAVGFVGLSGARALLAVYRALALSGYELVLVADSPAFVELLALLGCGNWRNCAMGPQAAQINRS